MPDVARPISVDILHDADAWKAVTGADDLVAAAASAAWRAAQDERSADACGISILLADDAALQALNRQWRGKDTPTNVLSFPAADMPLVEGEERHLGDLALSYDTLVREAAAEGKTLPAHLQHLVVHGVLHLAGFDHETEADADRMEALETAVLADLGVPDPYAAAS